jgi:plastocyanin
MRGWVVVPASVLLAVAGCGGTSKKSNPKPAGAAPATSTAPSSASGGTLAVSETEFKLDPATLTVKGGSLKITVRNAGTTVHALSIEKGGPGGSDARTADIQPGAQATLSVTLKPGKYEVYCPIDGHKGLGMKGTIVVGASGAANAPKTKQKGGASGGGSPSSY